jgi:hypothetical protein
MKKITPGRDLRRTLKPDYVFDCDGVSKTDFSGVGVPKTEFFGVGVSYEKKIGVKSESKL